MRLEEVKKEAKERFGVVYPSHYSEETIRQHFANMSAPVAPVEVVAEHEEPIAEPEEEAEVEPSAPAKRGRKPKVDNG